MAKPRMDLSADQDGVRCHLARRLVSRGEHVLAVCVEKINSGLGSMLCTSRPSVQGLMLERPVHGVAVGLQP